MKVGHIKKEHGYIVSPILVSGDLRRSKSHSRVEAVRIDITGLFKELEKLGVKGVNILCPSG